MTASTGAQLLTTLGTSFENPNPTGAHPSRSLCVKATWFKAGLYICGDKRGVWMTIPDLVISGLIAVHTQY